MKNCIFKLNATLKIVYISICLFLLCYHLAGKMVLISPTPFFSVLSISA